MKILIVNSHIPWGGLGQYSIGLAEALSAIDGCEVYGLVTHSNGGLLDLFSAATKKTTCLSAASKARRYYLALKMIWKLRPDVVLINYNAVVHYLLPFMPKSKVVSVLHSDDKDYYRVATINGRFVDGWIAPTPRIKQGILQHFKVQSIERKIHVIPHGVKKSTRSRSEVFQNGSNIVFAGALYRHKGVDLIPEIFRQFKNICPDARLTMLGNGNERQLLEERFDEFRLRDSVEFLGVVNAEKVREVFAQSDILLFPTRLEGFGLVIVEAMMEGVVPVVTNLESITDSIITDGVNGCMVEKDNVDAFVASLTKLFFDRGFARRISASAKETAVRSYSLDVMANKYYEVFSGACREIV